MPAESTMTVQGHPRATLICRPNSHPFQERNLALDHEVKIGRSVARAKPLPTNAIFDCKVLSRNHAVLWYNMGKFYLQDKKSSNGTFVNNQRLSKGSEESSPREVCSGDILQFGVDVVENSRKVTHGCIIATLKLYLPDGKEAKASQSILNICNGEGSIPTQDLYQLYTYIRESLAREQLLGNKLVSLQKIITETEVASRKGWKALMEEDRLLTRVEILEAELATYGKNMTEDKLREETKRLMEEKEAYQAAAKAALKQATDEKVEAYKQIKDVETVLANVEQEFNSLRGLYNKVIEENKRLSERVTTLSIHMEKKTAAALNNNNNNQTSDNRLEQDNSGNNMLDLEQLTPKKLPPNEDEKESMGGDLSESALLIEHVATLTENGRKGMNGGDISQSDTIEDEDESEYSVGDDDEGEQRRPHLLHDINGEASPEDDINKSLTNASCLENDFHTSTDSLDGSKPEMCEEVRTEGEGKAEDDDKDQRESVAPDLNLLTSETLKLKAMVDQLTKSRDHHIEELSKLERQLVEARNEHTHVMEELHNTKNKLEDAENLIESQDKLVKEMEEKIRDHSYREGASSSAQQQPLLGDGAPSAAGHKTIQQPESADAPTSHKISQQMGGNRPSAANDLSEPSHNNDGGQHSMAAATTAESNSVHLQEQIDRLTRENALLKDELDVYLKKPSSELQQIAGYHNENLSHPEAAGAEPPSRPNASLPEVGSALEGMSSSDADAVALGRGPSATGDGDEPSLNGGSSTSQLNTSCNSCGELSQVEANLAEAEQKIAKLLRVKEKLLNMERGGGWLEEDLSEMREDLQSVSEVNKVVTACTIIPVIVMFVAIFIAYLPSLSSLLGTREPL